MRKKVFVSGCFDLIHAGHVEFLKQASKYGDLYVSLGSDRTIRGLKNRNTVYSEDERVFIIKAIRYVKDAFVARGEGVMDFEKEILKLKPDIFVVNEEGDSMEKRNLCEELDIKYVVLKRTPPENLPKRSTTKLRRLLRNY
ncbi:adenylyltransferase/cytidyltransferase family protein [Patescibacteria group bacterium]